MQAENAQFYALLFFFIPIIIIWIKQGRCPKLPDVRSYLTLPYTKATVTPSDFIYHIAVQIHAYQTLECSTPG